jgi:subtilisin family serine protease
VVEVEGDPERAAERLDGSRGVDYAEPNSTVRIQNHVPNDPSFHRLWGFENYGQTGGRDDADIDATAGWKAAGLAGHPGTGGPPVGIVDTGANEAHLDLLGRIERCMSARSASGALTSGCYDDNGHGTHVTGTLGARANNGFGVAGVAFNSPLIVCNALGGSSGIGYVSDVASCIWWVKAAGARVINMSFAGSKSETIERAVEDAWDDGGRDGAVLLAAAGNGGDYVARYPAAYRGEVISVSATDDRDRLADFSNRHSSVDVSAPGDDIYSTWNDGGHRTVSGTSMATPHATAWPLTSGACGPALVRPPFVTACWTRPRTSAPMGATRDTATAVSTSRRP